VTFLRFVMCSYVLWCLLFGTITFCNSYV
jgi:hypothetical protein